MPEPAYLVVGGGRSASKGERSSSSTTAGTHSATSAVPPTSAIHIINRAAVPGSAERTNACAKIVSCGMAKVAAVAPTTPATQVCAGPEAAATANPANSTVM